MWASTRAWGILPGEPERTGASRRRRWPPAPAAPALTAASGASPSLCGPVAETDAPCRARGGGGREAGQWAGCSWGRLLVQGVWRREGGTSGSWKERPAPRRIKVAGNLADRIGLRERQRGANRRPGPLADHGTWAQTLSASASPRAGSSQGGARSACMANRPTGAACRVLLCATPASAAARWQELVGLRSTVSTRNCSNVALAQHGCSGSGQAQAADGS